MLRTASFLLLATGLTAFSLPASAQDRTEWRQPHITVTGDGEQSLRPDIAILSFGVMREAETAQAAMQANNEAMAAVTRALKEAGIEDRDLQTAGIQISPRYEYPSDGRGGQTAELVGYQVTNTLTVRVRDLARAGDILDEAVSLGVNQGGGISFTNDDPSAALSDARRKAVADAMEKARTLAEAAGVSLGPHRGDHRAHAERPAAHALHGQGRRHARIGADRGGRERLPGRGGNDLRHRGPELTEDMSAREDAAGHPGGA